MEFYTNYDILRLDAKYLVFFGTEFEVGAHDIVYKVVEVGAIDESFSLVAWIHGCPAHLIIGHLALHKAPDWTAHDRYWLFVGHDQDLTDFINFYSLAEKLPWNRQS